MFEPASGCQPVMVNLTNPVTGLVRRVPVLEAAKGERLVARARDVGDGRTLLVGSRKNRVNAVQQQVQRQEPRLTVSALRLRQSWIVGLANRVPAALLLQLADIGDTRMLAQLRPWMDTYDDQRAIQALAVAA